MVTGRYDIYWYKGQAGDTPIQPVSPKNEIGTSPVDSGFTMKKGAIIALGALVVKRTIDTVRNEIGASTGNEVLQTNINNLMQGITYATAIIVGGVPAAVAIGVNAALQGVVQQRELDRKNLALKREREMQGKRIDLINGSAYYG